MTRSARNGHKPQLKAGASRPVSAYHKRLSWSSLWWCWGRYDL